MYHVPYPSDLHGISTQDSLDAIERLFKSDIEAKQVAAIIFEPVQGEGGFNVAPKELVAAIRRLCDEHGIVMIADEVQSGFARTGKLFAMDHYADKPDLMTMAKSLAGGMPLSGVVGNANIMDAPAPGGLGGTYAGNPLAVAAAHAVLNIIDKESLCERAMQLGQRLTKTLIDAKENVPAIAAVRGLGSMIAAEFNDPQTGEPSAAIAQKNSATRAGAGTASTDLWRIRQRDSFPVSADHPGCAIRCGNENFAGCAERLIRRSRGNAIMPDMLRLSDLQTTY